MKLRQVLSTTLALSLILSAMPAHAADESLKSQIAAHQTELNQTKGDLTAMQKLFADSKAKTDAVNLQEGIVVSASALAILGGALLFIRGIFEESMGFSESMALRDDAAATIKASNLPTGGGIVLAIAGLGGGITDLIISDQQRKVIAEELQKAIIKLNQQQTELDALSKQLK